jgi:hypothetical protein
VPPAFYSQPNTHCSVDAVFHESNCSTRCLRDLLGGWLQDLIAPVLIFQCLEQYDFMGATVIGTVLLGISLVIMLLVNWIQRCVRLTEIVAELSGIQVQDVVAGQEREAVSAPALTCTSQQAST